jgi:glycosyltransferase involved in cell wall biosynthesis
VLILSWRDTGHPDAGGSEIYVERIARGLAMNGHPVTLCTASYAGAAAEELADGGIRVVRAGDRFSVYGKAAALYRGGKLGRPDVILEVQNGVPYLSRLWARDTRHVVLVHHLHRAQWHMIFGPIRARIGWWVESILAPRVNRNLPYLTISRASKHELAEIGVRRTDITVAYSGTDSADKAPVARTLHPSLVVLGRLVPHKRVEIAIDTVATLSTEFPDIELVVVGEGWWHERLSEYARAAGVSGRVRITGFLPENEKQELLARSWVSLLPSAKEGWGLVIAEAGLQETPTIAFADAGGVTESVIHGRTGLLVAGDDQAAFTEATRSLLLDPHTRARLGREARRHATTFDWDGTVRTVSRVIAGACTSPIRLRQQREGLAPVNSPTEAESA